MSTQTSFSGHAARPDSLDEIVRRVRAEYKEMPGLSLTVAQAQRLWTLDPSTCGIVLRRLVESRFLRTTARGRYVRAEHAAG
jgi:hypothetical protein